MWRWWCLAKKLICKCGFQWSCNMKFRTPNQNLHSLLSKDLIVALKLGYLKGSYLNFGLVFWISCCKITAIHSWACNSGRDSNLFQFTNTHVWSLNGGRFYIYKEHTILLKNATSQSCLSDNITHFIQFAVFYGITLLKDLNQLIRSKIDNFTYIAWQLKQNDFVIHDGQADIKHSRPTHSLLG